MITRSIQHDTLDQAQLSMLSAMLDEQRQFRAGQVAQLEASATPARRALTDVDREITGTLLRGARQALADIEAARTRMTDGTYGRCVECGTQLPIARLEVLPYVALCIACQHRAGP